MAKKECRVLEVQGALRLGQDPKGSPEDVSAETKDIGWCFLDRREGRGERERVLERETASQLVPSP